MIRRDWWKCPAPPDSASYIWNTDFYRADYYLRKLGVFAHDVMSLTFKLLKKGGKMSLNFTCWKTSPALFRASVAGTPHRVGVPDSSIQPPMDQSKPCPNSREFWRQLPSLRPVKLIPSVYRYLQTRQDEFKCVGPEKQLPYGGLLPIPFTWPVWYTPEKFEDYKLILPLVQILFLLRLNLMKKILWLPFFLWDVLCIIPWNLKGWSSSIPSIS